MTHSLPTRELDVQSLARAVLHARPDLSEADRSRLLDAVLPGLLRMIESLSDPAAPAEAGDRSGPVEPR
jgi:hypothetical protein